jgi:alpha-galactosidase
MLGCDLQKLDPFTRSLITNDEVLDIDQDSLAKQATCIAKTADTSVYAKPLDDGTWAVGLVNRGALPATITLNWTDLHLATPQVVRDLWRQKDLGTYNSQYSAQVAPHGIQLVRITPAH